MPPVRIVDTNYGDHRHDKAPPVKGKPTLVVSDPEPPKAKLEENGSADTESPKAKRKNNKPRK